MNIILILLTIIIIISIVIYHMKIEFIKIDNSIDEKNQSLKKKTCNCGKKPKRIN
jgi:predicted Holliday junction resolvase-like endonuclease